VLRARNLQLRFRRQRPTQDTLDILTS
jgi:hypothetical protein